MENSEIPGLPANEKNKFDSDYRQPALPFDLEEKTVRELKKRDLFKRNNFSSNRFFKPALGLLLIGALFLSGFFIGQRSQHSKALVTNDELYLFLLYNPIGFVESNNHVKEYSEWYRSNMKQMVRGEELKNEGWAFSTTSEKPATLDKNEVSGYFIIHASSRDEAFRLAASCPHLKYNGKIEVRPIVK